MLEFDQEHCSKCGAPWGRVAWFKATRPATGQFACQACRTVVVIYAVGDPADPENLFADRAAALAATPGAIP